MSFLTPLFLLGGLAIAGPILFHLIRRATKDRTAFSSLLFLKPTPPRLNRRSRIENWLLLALRCLALGLLALGFARPFLPKATAILPSNSQSKRIVLLLDGSASLQRPGAAEAARSQALAQVRQLSDAQELAVLTFDRSLRTLVSYADWKATPPSDRAALVEGRLNDWKPGWSGTQMASALMGAAETLMETGTGAEPQIRQLVLISDFQEGSHLESLQSYEWPKGVELVLDPVVIRPPGNAGLHLVTEENSATPASNAVVRVRVSNTADHTRDQFEVGWLRPDGNGFQGTPTKAYVPAGQSRTLVLPLPEVPGVQRLQLTGDPALFDNTVHVAPVPVTRARVLYVGADDAATPRQPQFFLRRAFPEGTRPVIDWTTRKPDVLTPVEAAAATGLTVVTAPLPATTAQALRAGVDAGGTVLFLAGSPEAVASAGELVGTPTLASQKASATGGALLGEIDFRHPLFAPFADPRFSDFTKIRLWKHQQVDFTSLTNARVLARLDSGDPGLVEIPLGRGRVIVMPWGWTPEDSQWVLSTKFVPFLYALLEYSGAVPTATVGSFQVGDDLPLPGLLGSNLRMQLPDGTEVALTPGATNFSGTRLPGSYRLLGSSSPLLWAVNLEPSESRTLPTAADDLERLGAPLARDVPATADTQARNEHVKAAEAEGQQKLWRWILGATFLILVLESVAAGWSARKNQSKLQEATA
jgi:hypothetical protein